MGALGLISDQEISNAWGKRSTSCVNAADFKKYFHENMSALGLPAPTGLFTSFGTALGEVRLIVNAVNVGGAGATIGELAFATTLAEALTVVAGVSAAAYAGALVGSLIIATQRTVFCGASIADAIIFIEENGLPFKTPKAFFANNPEILNPSMPKRSAYAERNTVKK